MCADWCKLRVVTRLFGVILTTGLYSTEVYADERAQLEIAVSRFKAAQYDKALALLEEILAKPVNPKDKSRSKLLNEARPVYAAALIWLNREAEADVSILVHLRADPFYVPPPGEFHQKVVERFIKVRSEHRAEIEKAKREIQTARENTIAAEEARKNTLAKRIAQLERLAATERVVRRRSRWVALGPFGIGQFQNDAPGLGVLFATGQGLSLVGSLVSGIIAQDLASTQCGTPDTGTLQAVDCDQLAGQFKTARTINWVSGGAFAGLLLGGIVQAQVVFEAESTEIRDRPRSGRVSIAPWVGPETGAAGATLGFRF